MSNLVGQTITLDKTEVYLEDVGGDLTTPGYATGEFSVEEYWPYEPAAYCYEAGYLIHSEQQGIDAFLPIREIE